MTKDNERMDNLITITIDGREVAVPAGATVLDAANALGIHIPTLCYYAKLVPVGACRMCLVEVEKMRGLQTACTTEVRPGMVVRTDTAEIRTTRAMNLEFLLTNHPLDCPVCDKGGECELQDYTFLEGPSKGRFIEEKRRKIKAKPLGPYIIMDQERCILCRRCVRFLQEWADDVQLGVFERGALSFVDVFDEEPLTSLFAGNVTHLCPVGALTSRVFRFSARAWELSHTPSICTDCAVGCNISLDVKVNRLKRIVPREHAAVNDEWLCNRGQFDHRLADASLRTLKPAIRRDGALKPASWEEALSLAASRLRQAVESDGLSAVVFSGSASASNEENYLLQRLARGALGTNNLVLEAAIPPRVRLLAGTRRIEKSDLVLVAGTDLADTAPMLELFARHAGVLGTTRFIVLGSERTHLAKFGTWLACPSGGEPAVVHALVRAILAKGAPRPAAGADALRTEVAPFTPSAVGVDAGVLEHAVDVLLGAGSPLILYGGTDEALADALGNLALVLGAEGPAYVPAQANAVGALDMGVAPNFWPGFQDYSDGKAADRMGQFWGRRLSREPGLGLEALRAGATPRVLFSLGRPPADVKADFLVVQTCWEADVPPDADVVLPASSFAEADGTYTNLAGRVQRARAALRPMGESRPGWQILTELGARLADDAHWAFGSAEAVFAEIARLTPGYNALSYKVLGEAGVPRDIQPPKPAVKSVR